MAKTFDFLEESLALLESDRTDVTDDEVRKFIENELFIKDKMTNRIIPFKFNSIQDVYWKQKSPFDYILKYRKGGFSTLTMAEYFARAVLLPDQQVVFLAHRKESVSIIFQTMHIFYQRLSDEWKERINGKRRSAQVQAKNELRFSKNGSQIIAMTGASPDAMRGMTPSMVHMCLAPDCLVRVKDGFVKRVADVAEGEVITTHTGRGARVMRRSCTPASHLPNGNKALTVTTWSNAAFPATCTPDHRLMTEDGWKEARELTTQDWMLVQRVRDIEESITEIPFDTSAFASSSYRKGMDTRKKEYPATIPLNEEFGFFLGLWLAEGSLFRQTTGPRNLSGITFSLCTDEDHLIERIRPILEAYCSSYRVDRPGGQRLVLTAYGFGMARLIDELVQGYKTRTIPDVVWKWPKECLYGMVEGIIVGDGGDLNRPNRMFSLTAAKRPQLVLQLRDLIASLGFGYCGICYQGPNQKWGRNNHGRYILTINGPTGAAMAERYGWKYNIPSSERHAEWTMRWKYSDNRKRIYAKVRSIQEAELTEGWDLVLVDRDHSFFLPGMVSHNSEISFWRPESVEESISSILGSIPPNGRARIETTPSSAGTWAYQEWQRAAHNESQFNPRFYTWWDDPWNCLKGVSWTDLGRLSEREQQLVEAYNLSSEQIAWRRKYQKAQGTKFIREYPEDAETCWVRSGSTVFDMDVVIRNYGGVEPNEEQIPGLTVHKKPEIGHAYIIGADPAGNTEDGDFSAAVCFDEDTGEEMFSYYNRLPIHDFGSLLHRLGEEYNQALISPERNNHGHAVVQYLTMTEPYDNLSVDEDGKVGIQTTPKSKTKMIANLDEYLWHDGLQLKSRELFRELAAYVYDERMRANAGIGHDDLVSATLVAVWTLQQMSPRDWDQGTGAVVPQPKQIALPPPPQMPATIDENEALKYSVMQMMVTSGLPFQNVGGSLFGDQGLQYPKVGCPTCGSATSTMKNGFWTCDGCGGVSVGRLFNETPA